MNTMNIANLRYPAKPCKKSLLVNLDFPIHTKKTIGLKYPCKIDLVNTGSHQAAPPLSHHSAPPAAPAASRASPAACTALRRRRRRGSGAAGRGGSGAHRRSAPGDVLETKAVVNTMPRCSMYGIFTYKVGPPR